MRFLVIGGGSIGKRHLKNLLFLKQEVAVCEPVVERAKAIKKEFNVSVFSNAEKGLKEGFDAVVIANPNVYHLSSALIAAKYGCHLFIEKPLSHNLNGVDELVEIIERKKLKMLMGSNFKFHPSFKLIKQILDEGTIGKIISFSVIAGQYLPDWHPWEDYRKGYSANKSLGGGVLLDSHEFDYLQWFLGPIKKLACFAGRYSNLEIDTEDIAELIVELENKIVGNIHVDYIQRPYKRVYSFYGEKGTMEWSFLDKKISLYSANKNTWEYFKEDSDYDLNEMYAEEMKHFINVIKGKEESITDIYKAKQILEVVESAKKSFELGRVINL